jgi:hypothetical protein
VYGGGGGIGGSVGASFDVVLDLVPLLGPNPRDGGSVEDDPADHDRVCEEADLFADARDLGQQEEPPMPLGPRRPTLSKNYPSARVKVGIRDSYMLQQGLTAAAGKTHAST